MDEKNAGKTELTIKIKDDVTIDDYLEFVELAVLDFKNVRAQIKALTFLKRIAVDDVGSLPLGSLSEVMEAISVALAEKTNSKN